MKTILILFLLGLHVGLCAQKHIEIKASFEVGNSEITPYFKLEVKNVTDSTLIIFNNSEYWGEGVFNPKNSYFVADYILKNGKSDVTSGIPLMINKNKRIILVEPHQSIKNEFNALQIAGIYGFSGIFPPKFDLSKVEKVRFRLVKLIYGLRFGPGLYPEQELSSNWVTLKGL